MSILGLFVYLSDLVDNIWGLQTTGAFKAAARLASATPPPAYVLSRGIGWQVSDIILASIEIDLYLWSGK